MKEHSWPFPPRSDIIFLERIMYVIIKKSGTESGEQTDESFFFLQFFLIWRIYNRTVLPIQLNPCSTLIFLDTFRTCLHNYFDGKSP